MGFGFRIGASVNVEDFETAVGSQYLTLQSLLLRKHQDYGPTNISAAPGGPLNGLRVRIHDKVARINHLIEADVPPTNESLQDSFADLANYAVIALLVLNGSWPK
jgi:predicted nucleotide modification protein, DUF1599 family